MTTSMSTTATSPLKRPLDGVYRSNAQNAFFAFTFLAVPLFLIVWNWEATADGTGVRISWLSLPGICLVAII